VLAQIMVDQPVAPSKHRPDIGRELDSICLRAMAKKIEDRYASMAELAKALGDYLAGRRGSAEPAAGRHVQTVPLVNRDRLGPVGKPAKTGEPPATSTHPREAGGRKGTAKKSASNRPVGQTAVSRVVDENLEQFFAAVAEEETPLARSKPRQPNMNGASRFLQWPWLAAGALALIVLGGIIYFATHMGTKETVTATRTTDSTVPPAQKEFTKSTSSAGEDEAPAIIESGPQESSRAGSVSAKGLGTAARDDGLSGAFLVEFAKDKGWWFVYEFSGAKMQRKLVKTSPGADFAPIGGEATVQRLEGGKFLLVHRERGEHELWQPAAQSGTFQIQRGDEKTYVSNPLKGTARKLAPDELQDL
jgi:hypothetical protein